MITDRSEAISAAKVQKNIGWAEVAGAIGQSPQGATIRLRSNTVRPQSASGRFERAAVEALQPAVTMIRSVAFPNTSAG